MIVRGSPNESEEDVDVDATRSGFSTHRHVIARSNVASSAVWSRDSTALPAFDGSEGGSARISSYTCRRSSSEYDEDALRVS